MRKKLDTRFPAPRIKKIMQADEEVGKIAMAVPLLVSKALELFLQDLCDRTYEITLNKGAKTVNSVHLKQCVQSFNVFDFLKDTVSKVPDLGGSDAAAEDKSAVKRRKISENEEHDNDDEPKKIVMHETGHDSSTVRGRGRPRGRGRGRGRGKSNRALDRDSVVKNEKFEDTLDISHQNGENGKEDFLMHDNIADVADSKKDLDQPVRNFDLNIDLNEDGDSTMTLPNAPCENSKEPAHPEIKHEDIPGWSLEDMEKMAIDPVQLANFNGGMDEEDEDYDEEE